MTSLSGLLLLVFPGFFAVWLSEFFWGRRGRPSADRVVDAAVYSILGLFVYIGVSGDATFADLKESQLLASSTLRALAWVTVVSTAIASVLALLTRSRWFRDGLSRITKRNLTHDILYDKYLDSLNALRRKDKTAQPMTIVKLKSGLFVKGELRVLSDNVAERSIFLTNVDLYDLSWKGGLPLDVFHRDDPTIGFIDGAGLWIRLAEVDAIMLGIDQNKWTGFIASHQRRANPAVAAPIQD